MQTVIILKTVVFLSSLSVDWFGVCAEIEGNVTCGSWTHIMGILLDIRFQFIVPKRWQKNRPVCIHLAGTGDHVRLKNIPMWCVALQCNNLHPFPHAPAGSSSSCSFCCAHNLLCVCAVFLAQTNPDGPTHDQRGGDGFVASGESLLYPFVSFLFRIWLLHLRAKVDRWNTVLALRTCHLVRCCTCFWWCLLFSFLDWPFYMAIVNLKTSCKF